MAKGYDLPRAGGPSWCDAVDAGVIVGSFSPVLTCESGSAFFQGRLPIVLYQFLGLVVMNCVTEFRSQVLITGVGLG